MLLAQAATIARLPAFLERTDFIARLRHFAVFPQPIMLAAVSLRDYFAFTIIRLAGALVRH